jgi:hypothetical protein
LHINRIPVGKHARQCGEIVDSGLDVGTIDETRVLAEAADHPEDTTAWCLDIEDNGPSGDGCWLKIYHQERRTSDDPVVILDLPDDSLPLLVAALQTVVRLRQAVKAGELV